VDAPSDKSHFTTILAESGMEVPSDQLSSLFEGYQHLLRLVALLGEPLAREAEPAVIFAPDAE
jgi:hypothetical protein